MTSLRERRHLLKLDISIRPELEQKNENNIPRLGKDIKYTIDNGSLVTIYFERLKRICSLNTKCPNTAYKVYDKEMDVFYVIQDIYGTFDNSTTKRFLKDLYGIVTEYNSSYLIRYFGAFLVEDYHWILKEYMDTTIERFYHKAFELHKKLPEVFLSKIAFSVLNAIDFLFKKGMQAYPEPSNILVNINGQIKLDCFNTDAYLLENRPRVDNIYGVYISPEYLTQDPNTVENKAKRAVWSLGISMIEIANGQHPFAVKESSLFEILKFILDTDPPKLSPDKFSDEFCKFVDACLKKDPEERANISTLLNSEFITKYENESIDSNFIKSIIESVQADY